MDGFQSRKLSGIDDLQVLSDRVSQQPDEGLRYISDLINHMESDEEAIRYESLSVLVQLAVRRPLQLRSVIEPLLRRFDDVSERVRFLAQQIGYCLADFWVIELSSATDLLANAATADSDIERYMSRALLSKLSVYRPDLVTPQTEIHNILSETDYMVLVEPIDNPSFDESLLDDAVYALDGGDIESRPLNEDLSPTPNGTHLSKSARLGIHGFWWGVMAFLLPVLIMINLSVFVSRVNKYPSRHQPKLVANMMKKITFFTDTDTLTLYTRASVWPTPSEHISLLPGEKPMKKDTTNSTPDLPHNWGDIASSVRRRDGYQCVNCGDGNEDHSSVSLFVDHKVPRTRGGDDLPHNLRTLCESCEQARHATIFDR